MQNSASRRGHPAMIVILATITLDAIGGGLIFPILPTLLADLSGGGDYGLLYGGMLAVFTLFQFVFSPVLGALSDRFGRRPILILSLIGALFDYLMMALTPYAALLLVGRAIAGLTSANMAVASAYITDITPEDQRAARFGLMGAMMGLGFILGPALGGLLGLYWVRLPFLAAALMNGANVLLALFILPESHKGERVGFDLSALNPLKPLAWLASLKPILPMVGVALVFDLIAPIPGAIWVLYCGDRYGWDPMLIGLSLTGFGIATAASQAGLVAPITKRLGTLGTIALGAACDALGYLLMGLAPWTWMVFATIPLFALGGLAMPALQSLLTAEVDAEHQGQLQGVLASLASLGGIIGPVGAVALYFATKEAAIGTVWIVGAALYLLSAPVFLSARKAQRRQVAG